MPASLVVFVLPLAAGTLAFVLRRWRSIEVLIAAVACAMAMLLLAQPDGASFFGLEVNGQLDLFGRTLQIDPRDRSALLLMFGCGLLLIVASLRTPENWTFVPAGMMLLGVLSATLMIRPFQYAGLLYVVAGALGALLIQAEHSGERSTLGATRFLVISVIALPMFLGAGYVSERAAAVTDPELISGAYAPAVQFLIIGFGLVMGAIPLFTWVHPVAKDAPPLTTAFISVTGIGAASFLLLGLMGDFAWLRNAPLMSGALSSGAVLLLAVSAALGWAQNSLSRVLACGILLEIGCTLLAIASNTQQSIEAIGFGMMARALTLGLFGIGAALLRERNGGDEFSAIRGSGMREPWLALAVGLGGLSLAGMPGTVGFVSHWLHLRAFDGNAEQVALTVLAGISVAAGVLRGLAAMFEPADGTQPRAKSMLAEQARGELWTVGIGTVLMFVFGLFPGIIAPLAQVIAQGYVR